jgi:deoxyribose-phosphate aldolase
LSAPDGLASLIDHTLLRADARAADVQRLCEEARHHGFATVCVNPRWVARASEWLEGSEVQVCTVIGFPFGATYGATKAAETDEAVLRGASELEMVIDIGALLDGDHRHVRRDIEQVVEAAQGRLVKVILETAVLDEAAKRLGATLARDAGADFVKTSTGFGPGGATVDDVRLLRSIVGDAMGVKASGGIRSRRDALAMLEAGADRLGTGSGVRIISESEVPS